MNKKIIAGVGVAVVGVVGVVVFEQFMGKEACAEGLCAVDLSQEYVYEDYSQSAPVEVNSNGVEVSEVGEVAETEVATDDVLAGDALARRPGTFAVYSAEAVAAASGPVVIFFHATWCPSCRALKSDIENNLTAIPPNITILSADYDTATELKRQYGVTTQHTLVQVGTDGTMIQKWSGGSRLGSVLERIR
jgi:thioredoxin 1